MEQNALQRTLSRITKIVLYVISGAIGIALMLLAVILIWYATLDIEKYHDRIEIQLSKSLGRDVRITGKVELKGILAPHLIAEKIRIANASWGSAPDLASAQRFEIKIDLFSLLRKDIQIQELKLVGAKLHMERNDDDVPNWLTNQLDPQTTNVVVIPDIATFSIEDSTIFHHIKNRPPISIKIDTFKASFPMHRPVSFQGSLDYQNLPFKFAMQADSLQKLFVSKETWNIQGNLLINRYPLRLEGGITDPVDLKEVQLKLTTLDKNKRRTIIEGKDVYKVEAFNAELAIRAIEDKHKFYLTVSGKKLSLNNRAAAGKIEKPGVGLALDSLSIDITGAGQDVNEIIENSAISFIAKNGGLHWGSNQSKAKKTLLIKRFQGSAKPRQKFKSEIDIQYSKKKIYLELVYGRLINLFWGEKPWPFKVDIKTANLKGSMDAKIDLSKSNKKVAASIKLQGKHSSINLKDAEFSIEDGKDLFSDELIKADWILSVAKGFVQYWESEAQPTVHNIDISNVAVKGDRGNISFSLNAGKQGVTSRVSGKTAALDYFINKDKPIPFDISMSGDAFVATADSLLSKPFENFSVTGKYYISIKNPTKVGSLFKQDWQWQHPVISEGLFNYVDKNGSLVLEKLSLKTLGADIHGRVKYSPNTNQEVGIDIQRADLDLASYLGKDKPVLDSMIEDEGTDNKATEKPERLIPDIEFDGERFKPWNITANISNFRIFSSNEHFVTIRSRVSLVNSILSVSGFESINLAGSSTTGKLSVDASGDVPRATVSAITKNLDYGQLLKVTGVSGSVSGRVDLKLDLKGQGSNLQELLANSEGELEFVSHKGAIPRKLLEIWGGGLLRIFLPTTWVGEDTTDLNCAVGRFVVKQGVMNSDVLLADTKKVTVAGDLKVNFKTEQINGLIKSKPKSLTLFRIDAPIIVSGTLAQPTAATEKSLKGLGKFFIGLVDPTYMLVLFSELGAKEKNPCAALLKQKQ